MVKTDYKWWQRTKQGKLIFMITYVEKEDGSNLKVAYEKLEEYGEKC
ncbi:hypothetical protein Lalb_Chr25g0282141 [Lupinus albus]|uniref:Uncharacterized protein n=1 Tax=Lupinus albus TaxID=3870 RepID=A0A6A4MY47_LUPAL|nr:hypothetical protein Lalb_Chr25g0282141 [Lupinus albus]